MSRHALIKSKTEERFKVNVLHRGKERFKYCTTMESALALQKAAVLAGLSSIILKKIDGKYRSI